MQGGAKRFGRLLAFLRKQVARDAEEAALSKRFAARKRGRRAGPAVLAVQCITDDLYYFAVFGEIATRLRATGNMRIDRVVTHSLNVGELDSVIAFLGLRWVVNVLLIRKWSTMYGSFCDRVAYGSSALAPVADIADLASAWRCWKELDDKHDLMELQIDGIPVGDLVNDSYLRFKPAPTVDLGDPYLCVVLWQAFRDVRRANAYFSKVRPKAYLTSYSTYVQHGIAVRVALQSGVQVLSFGNFQEFSKALSTKDWVHTRNAERYARDFAALGNQPARLELARNALQARVTGKIDAATSYMQQSAYAESGEDVPDVDGLPVVFLHDFFDSPHVFYDMVFDDFWEWVCFTLDTFQKAGIPVAVKPHPNQISLSGGVLKDLVRRYRGVKFLSPRITNRQLADAGAACAITVYGTVAHEMAFLGVPSIACARHPHTSFSFCRTARNRTEYAEMLLSFADQPATEEQLVHESLMFYYMHNLSLPAEEKELSDSALALRRDCGRYAQTGKGIVPGLNEFVRLPGFLGFVDGLKPKA